MLIPDYASAQAQIHNSMLLAQQGGEALPPPPIPFGQHPSTQLQPAELVEDNQSDLNFQPPQPLQNNQSDLNFQPPQPLQNNQFGQNFQPPNLHSLVNITRTLSAT